MDVSEFLPNGFNLRQGAGGGDPKNGLCFMETVAMIAGEKIGDHPECACPALTSFGIALNDNFTDEDRRLLMPLAWATAGTRSEEHRVERQRIIAKALVDAARIVLPIFEARHPLDKRPRAALDAADAYLANPTIENKEALDKAKQGAFASASASASAFDSASAYASASASAYASASTFAYTSASAPRDLQIKVRDRLLNGLRDAIKAGPNGGFPDEIVIERINRVRDLLPVAAE